MPANGYLCTAGFEGIIPVLIIVFVIVSQIRKALRKGQPPLSDGPPADGIGNSPEDELRSFLRGLQDPTGQVPTQPVAPARPPPSARRPPPLPVARVQQAPMPPAPAPARPTVHQAVQQPYAPGDRWRTKREAAVRRKEEKRRPHASPVIPLAIIPAQQVAALASTEIRDLIEDDPYSTERTSKELESVQSLRVSLGTDLISRDSLRKAILLTEVLGRPLALRGPAAKGLQQ